MPALKDASGFRRQSKSLFARRLRGLYGTPFAVVFGDSASGRMRLREDMAALTWAAGRLEAVALESQLGLPHTILAGA